MRSISSRSPTPSSSASPAEHSIRLRRRISAVPEQARIDFRQCWSAKQLPMQSISSRLLTPGSSASPAEHVPYGSGGGILQSLSKPAQISESAGLQSSYSCVLSAAACWTLGLLRHLHSRRLSKRGHSIMNSCVCTPSLGAHSSLANLCHLGQLLRNLEWCLAYGLFPCIRYGLFIIGHLFSG